MSRLKAPPDSRAREEHIASVAKAFTQRKAFQIMSPFARFCPAIRRPGDIPKFADGIDREIVLRDVVAFGIVRLSVEMVPPDGRPTGTLREVVAAVECFLRHAPIQMRGAGFASLLAMPPAIRVYTALTHFLAWERDARMAMRHPRTKREQLLAWLWTSKAYPISKQAEAQVRSAAERVNDSMKGQPRGWVTAEEVVQALWVRPKKSTYFRNKAGDFCFDVRRLRDIFRNEIRRSRKLSRIGEVDSEGMGAQYSDPSSKDPSTEAVVKEAMDAVEAARVIGASRKGSKDDRAIFKHLLKLLAAELTLADISRLEGLDQGNLSRSWKRISQDLARLPGVAALNPGETASR